MVAVVGQAERQVAGLLRHLVSILLLPFMNTVIIPAVLLVSTFDAGASPGLGHLFGAGAAVRLAVGLPVLFGGMMLVVSSIERFAVQGDGTLAPWDPPRRLVIAGPYRWLRNPMKAGLIMILSAEALLFVSLPLAAWLAFFTSVNVLYIRWSEEPGLARRFGREYAEYCAAVPRWLPSLHR